MISFISSFLEARFITKFNKKDDLANFCSFALVRNSLPNSFHTSLSYSENISLEKSFFFIDFFATSIAHFAETIALPIPSPVKGSTKPAASPSSINPLP